MTFLTFLYIFDFNIIKNISYTESAFFVAIVLFAYLLLNPKYNNEVSKMLSCRHNKAILINMLLLVIIAILWPIAFLTFDFTYAMVLIHQLIELEIGVMLIALYKYKKRGIFETVLNCFLIQSTIQLICFLSPTITSITDIFRSDSLISQREANYMGYRGLAISGSNFFGLSVAYAIVFIVLSFYWEKWNRKLSFKLLSVFLLLFGAMSAGRTAIVGIVFFVIFRIVKTISSLNDLNAMKRVIASIALVVVFIVIFNNVAGNYLSQNASWQRFYFYLFQFIGEDGTANATNVSSLSHLFNDMYFKLTPSQFWLGDARYTADSGKYYMSTDAGYMRNLLFFGIFGTAVLYLYQYKFLFYGAVGKKRKILPAILYISLAIFEFKGQTIGFLIISQCLLLLIIFDLDNIMGNLSQSK